MALFTVRIDKGNSPIWASGCKGERISAPRSSYRKFIEQEEEKKIPVYPITVPKPFKLSAPVTMPPPPANTPEYRKSQVSMSKRNLVTFEAIQKKIQSEHNKHVLQASSLLQQIQSVKVPVHRNPLSKSESSKTEVEPIMFKSKKVPPKKDVEIKSNIATTLREAALMIKEKEEEVNRIENLMKGGGFLQKAEDMLAEERKINSERAWEDIQKKHLLGLITFEESILAKKKLLDENRQKFLDVKAEKIDLYEKLDQYREQELEKFKAQIEKCQKMKQEAKEMEKKFFEKKAEEVRLQQFEIKEMLKKREEEKAAELAKKIELIQEIKNIHEINCKINEARKDFDPTESSNLGLLCEMSIVELRERLAIEKMKMNEELGEKRQRIQEKKRQQQNMLESYKEFVAQTRKAPKLVIGATFTPPKLKENAELLELRRQLEEKRSLRIKIS